MQLILGDSIEKLKLLEENSIDSIVTDPPYGLSFMGKKWDYDVPSKELWIEALRVLKPGGHLLSFAGSRTYHRMAVNIEDAGFEIRDQIMWVYGSGFPKSHNIGKSVDKLQGNEREEVDYKYQDRIPNGRSGLGLSGNDNLQVRKQDGDTKGSSPYEGRGTALKPAHEPIVVARKPFKGTVAKNVLEWGTGGINIDESRVGTETLPAHSSGQNALMGGLTGDNTNGGAITPERIGRFPANFIHDGSDEVVDLFPDSKSGSVSGIYGHKEGFAKGEVHQEHKASSGSAARFFYCAKASKKDRNEDCEDVITNEEGVERKGNCHPTVKPTSVMLYLIRLVTPVGGTVLDPFVGSGSTGKASVSGGFDFVGIDIGEGNIKIATARIKGAIERLKLTVKVEDLFSQTK